MAAGRGKVDCKSSAGRAGLAEVLSRGSCGGGVAFPGKALSRVQRVQRAAPPLVNNARWRAGEAPVPDSTARNS